MRLWVVLLKNGSRAIFFVKHKAPMDDFELQLQLAATPIYEKLRQLWLNEHFAPELLKFDSNFVLPLQQLIKKREDALYTTTDALHSFLKQLEIDRLKYMINCYLRARISKIEAQILYIMEREQEFDELLSDAEKKFVQGFVFCKFFTLSCRYSGIQKKFLDNSFLNALPESLRDGDGTEKNEEPNLNQFVFCKFKERIGDVSVSDEETEVVNQNDILITRYHTIRQILQQDKLELI